MDLSIKEVVNNINENWFLPAIQRPYVWVVDTMKKNISAGYLTLF